MFIWLNLPCSIVHVNHLNGHHVTDNMFICIFLKEIFCILIQISPEFVPESPIKNKLKLVHQWLGTTMPKAITLTNYDQARFLTPHGIPRPLRSNLSPGDIMFHWWSDPHGYWNRKVVTVTHCLYWLHWRLSSWRQGCHWWCFSGYP